MKKWSRSCHHQKDLNVNDRDDDQMKKLSKEAFLYQALASSVGKGTDVLSIHCQYHAAQQSLVKAHL